MFLILFLSLFGFESAHAGGNLCETPTKSDLEYFFGKINEWTEVKNSETHDIAKRNPIFMNINFRRPGRSVADWGNKSVNGSNITICRGANRDNLVIWHPQYPNIPLRFRRLSDGLIRSKFKVGPVSVRYYYRPDKVVNRTRRTSELLVDEQDNNGGTAVL